MAPGESLPESSPDDDFKRRVSELADQLGRPVCGAELADGEPCPAAPVREGRCAEHAAMLNRPQRAAGAAAGRTLLWVAVGLIAALAVVGGILQLRQDPAESLWRQAASLVAAGRPVEAEALYQAILKDHPESRFADQARRLLGISASPDGAPARAAGSDAQKLYQEARNYFPLGGATPSDLEEAAWRYVALADSWPADPLAREALYQAAQCYDHLGRSDDTVKTWELFLERYPNDGRSAEALYALGYVLLTERGDPDAAKMRFAELEAKFPQSSAAAAARVLMGGSPHSDPGVEVPGGSDAATSGRPSIRTEPGRL